MTKKDLILGIDIGGSGVKGALVDLRKGDFASERVRIPTPTPKTPESLLGAVSEIIGAFKWKGIVGCTFPGVVRSQVIETAANMGKDFIGINLAEQIGKACSCEAWIINDADAAGCAEMRYGAGKGNKETVLVLTVGTGIGSALFTGGRLVPNMEFGQLKMRDKKLSKSMPAEKICADSARKKADMTWAIWAGKFNKYLQYVHSLIWPNLIVLGGGLSSKEEKFMHLLNVDCDIVSAKLQNRAGIVGAALEAKKNLM